MSTKECSERLEHSKHFKTFWRRHVYHVENLVKIIKYFLPILYFVVIMFTFPYCAYF